MSVSARRRKQHVILHHELVSLAVFATRWLETEELHYTDVHRRKRCLEVLHKLLGSNKGPGLLQEKMDREMHGILSRLKQDFPTLRWKSILVFSYSAAGFTNLFSAKLAGLGGPEDVSRIKTRLRERIGASESPYKKEYLALLPRKGCRTGEELQYLNHIRYKTIWR